MTAADPLALPAKVLALGLEDLARLGRELERSPGGEEACEERLGALGWCLAVAGALHGVDAFEGRHRADGARWLGDLALRASGLAPGPAATLPRIAPSGGWRLAWVLAELLALGRGPLTLGPAVEGRRRLGFGPAAPPVAVGEAPGDRPAGGGGALGSPSSALGAALDALDLEDPGRSAEGGWWLDVPVAWLHD